MKFIFLTDINGRHHLVNPANIAVIQDVDAGCAIHMRERVLSPIVLEETTEVMRDVLETTELGEEKPRVRRYFKFGRG